MGGVWVWVWVCVCVWVWVWVWVCVCVSLDFVYLLMWLFPFNFYVYDVDIALIKFHMPAYLALWVPYTTVGVHGGLRTGGFAQGLPVRVKGCWGVRAGGTLPCHCLGPAGVSLLCHQWVCVCVCGCGCGCGCVVWCVLNPLPTLDVG